MKTLDDLYPFQKDDVEFFLRSPSCIVGHDMGTGKTVIGIAIDTKRRELDEGPEELRKTLVICPVSVAFSWVDHFAEWQPNKRVTVLNPKNRPRFLAEVRSGEFDVYIMHWDVLRLMPEIARFPWFHVIGDEAHRIGNRSSQVSVAARSVRHRYLTQLTGTPARTRPEQFWALLNWARPKLFNSYWRFFNTHVVVVAHDTSGHCRASTPEGEVCGKYHRSAFKVTTGVAEEAELHRAIAPFYRRRLLSEVAPELPEKIYSVRTVELSAKQRRVYDDLKSDALAWVGENENQPLATPAIISMLSRLMQAACAYLDITYEKKRQRQLDGTWEEVIVRRVKMIDPSTKLDAVMDIINDNPGEQIIVFSQSKQAIYLLSKRLAAAKISHGLLTGDTPQAEREKLVHDFQAGRVRVFAGTIQAGGEGITLTASATTIFIDRDWSPAANQQAEARNHRFGQTRPVNIIDIVAKDTLDRGRNNRIALSWQYIRKLVEGNLS